MKYLFYAIVFDVAGNTTAIGSLTSPAKTITTNIQKVTGISINPNSAQTKNIGENFTIAATVSPSDANNKGVTWSSSNSGVATVDNSGNVRCVSAGTTTITATAADGSGVKASLELTVRNPVNSISLSQSSITISKGGFNANITLTIDPSDYPDSNISWSIGNTLIATLSGSGKTRTITSTSMIGDTTLTVTAGGKTTTCAIHVVAFTSQTFSYTGTVQSVDLPAGIYTLEVWGAQGGNYNSYTGGKGGYSKGNINLTNNTTLYITVGGMGSSSNSTTGIVSGGWNGGGQGYRNQTRPGISGGGATDIALYGINNSTSWDTTNHLYSRIIVAGGGGAAANDGNTDYNGAGGGINGSIGSRGCGSGGSRYGLGGSINSGGGHNNDCNASSSHVNGCFGKGGYVTSTNCMSISGGGGGWYGGGNAAGDCGGGGGGSGWVYTEANYNTWKTTAEGKSENWRLNSSYYLTNTNMENGKREGNGQAKITLVN